MRLRFGKIPLLLPVWLLRLHILLTSQLPTHAHGFNRFIQVDCRKSKQ